MIAEDLGVENWLILLLPKEAGNGELTAPGSDVRCATLRGLQMRVSKTLGSATNN